MQSININHSWKVFEDIYLQLMTWAMWALGILLVGFLVAIVFIEPLRELEQSAMAMITHPARIFIFICGIVSGMYIIQYYIRQGVTRRSFFIGMAAAGIAVAASIQLIGAGLNGIAALIGMVSPYQPGSELSVYAGTSHSYPVTMGISTLMLSLQFLMGWIIGFSFYRYKGIGGFISICSTILVLGAGNLIWDQNAVISISGVQLSLHRGLSLTAAILFSLAILTAQLGALFLMIRNSPIKTN
ncbi:hypothetical protein [Spirochaeta dissipatitropha]